MLPVTFGIHKTFLVASTLAARLGPKPVYRNAKCRGGAESSAQAKASTDVPWCREGAHAKRPNSSRIRAHAKQNAPMRSFRKPRTAASFVPKACKTQASKNAKNTSQKKCFPSPLESIKHFLWPAPSLIRAHAKQNAPMRSFRKPRTAASFVPKACKTQARKKAAKNGAFATLPHGAETAGNGSEKAKRHYTSRARASQKRCVRNPSTRCRNCSFEAVKKNTGKGP